MRDRTVRAPLVPGLTAGQLRAAPPEQPVDQAVMLAEFAPLVPDGMTNWRHPRFFAFFPANASPAPMLAEQLANGMAAQCMLRQTSPAATELEEVMVDWRRQALGLAGPFRGTIHDTATTAELKPAGLVLSVGSAAVGGTDRIAPLINVALAHGLRTHVAAPWSGSAIIWPEVRSL